MIELLLQAEQVLALGLLDEAERLYWLAAEGDPNNAIAIVGLSRVALERGDERTALAFTRKALEIDPESATAGRMRDRLEEVIAHRGDPIPMDVDERPVIEPAAHAGPPPPPAEPVTPAEATPPPPVVLPPPPPPRRGLLRRLTRRS